MTDQMRTPRWAIQATNGMWLTGSCWGVREVRESYAWEDLPETIDDDTMDLEMYAETETNPEMGDARYYRGASASDSSASVVPA